MTEVVYVHGIVVQNASEREDGGGVEGDHEESVEDASAEVVANGYGVLTVVVHGVEEVAHGAIETAVAVSAAIVRASAVVGGEVVGMAMASTNDSMAGWE